MSKRLIINIWNDDKHFIEETNTLNIEIKKKIKKKMTQK